jgi:putative transposase
VSIPNRHASIPGTYFVTSRTWESRALFVNSEVCRIVIETLLRYRDEGAYALHAFVLMPDHFHALLTPAADKTLERVVQYIKGGSARRIGQERHLRFPVWQRGFTDHRIRTADDFANHLEYVVNNPVKRRIADQAQEYPWSSASGKWSVDPAPQRLKPHAPASVSGTAEAVPLRPAATYERD